MGSTRKILLSLIRLGVGVVHTTGFSQQTHACTFVTNFPSRTKHILSPDLSPTFQSSNLQAILSAASFVLAWLIYYIRLHLIIQILYLESYTLFLIHDKQKLMHKSTLPLPNDVFVEPSLVCKIFLQFNQKKPCSCSRMFLQFSIKK